MINIAQPGHSFDNCNSFYTAQWTETIVVRGMSEEMVKPR